jgi:menaquinone-specific isochorismate synthase
MTVTPYCKNRFQSRKDLYQFLSRCTQVSADSKQPSIVSISIEIDRVDPLAVLDKIAQPNQLNFYFEKHNLTNDLYSKPGGVAIAAIGSIDQLQVDAGSDRFEQAKLFIQSTIENTIIAGDSKLPFYGPHFFSSFSFLDHPSKQLYPFSAATIFLPEWQISAYGNRCTVVANVAVHPSIAIAASVETVWHTLQTIQASSSKLLSPPRRSRNVLQKQDVASAEHFKGAVQSALNSIRTKALNKIVLAQAVDVISPVPFQRIHCLNTLRQRYPDCYIFSISSDTKQHFLGASPERLVSLRDRQLVTDALAGSAPRGQTTCEDATLASNLLSNTKELHEHRVVIEFITQQLCQLGLTPQRSPLRLLQLSNIQHLQTPIHATVPPDIHLLDIVASLHPTPAVAGVPRDLACEYIHRYEPFERSLYAAPIGWVDHRGNGEFAVGIRSALIDGCHARLYAGAGIVAGSDPNRELAEVQLKLQALLQALV